MNLDISYCWVGAGVDRSFGTNNYCNSWLVAFGYVLWHFTRLLWLLWIGSSPLMAVEWCALVIWALGQTLFLCMTQNAIISRFLTMRITTLVSISHYITNEEKLAESQNSLWKMRGYANFTPIWLNCHFHFPYCKC